MKKYPLLYSHYCLILFLPLFLIGCGKYKSIKDLQGEELVQAAKKEGGVIYTYGMPDYWANYRAVFRAFEKKYGIKHLDIDMSSGPLIERLIREKENPCVDTAVIGISFEKQAKEGGILSGFRSSEIHNLPQWAIDFESFQNPSWYATYYGTLVFMVNLDIIKNVPRSWRDLLKPEYKNKIGYLDPRKSATGFATFIAANVALGGNLENLNPGIIFFKQLHKIKNIREVQPRQNFIPFMQGTMPILINYDYNLLIQKYKYKLNAGIVIPEEGTIRYPYINLIIKNPPHPYTQRLFINFILSEEAQLIMSESFVHPVISNIKLSDKILRYMPKIDEEKIHDVNWTNVEESLEKVKKEWDLILGK